VVGVKGVAFLEILADQRERHLGLLLCVRATAQQSGSAGRS
jgi:hypothetical protein